MGRLDDTVSLETNELAWELQQAAPDTCRIKWLLEMEADVGAAVKEAHIDPAVLQKNPKLKPLKLYQYLQKQ